MQDIKKRVRARALLQGPQTSVIRSENELLGQFREICSPFVYRGEGALYGPKASWYSSATSLATRFA